MRRQYARLTRPEELSPRCRRISKLSKALLVVTPDLGARCPIGSCLTERLLICLAGNTASFAYARLEQENAQFDPMAGTMTRHDTVKAAINNVR